MRNRESTTEVFARINLRVKLSVQLCQHHRFLVPRFDDFVCVVFCSMPEDLTVIFLVIKRFSDLEVKICLFGMKFVDDVIEMQKSSMFIQKNSEYVA